MFQLIQPYGKKKLIKFLLVSTFYLLLVNQFFIYLAYDKIILFFSGTDILTSPIYFLIILNLFLTLYPLGILYFIFYYDKVSIGKVYLTRGVNDYDGYDYHPGIRNKNIIANNIKEKFLLLMLDFFKVTFTLFIYAFILFIIFMIFIGIELIKKTSLFS